MCELGENVNLSNSLGLDGYVLVTNIIQFSSWDLLSKTCLKEIIDRVHNDDDEW